jgi:RNA polymerase sigma-70 factor (family 1)
MGNINSYPHLQDNKLLELVQLGDKCAFEIIYRKYAAPLFRYARRNISRKEDCEEMVQEVFESLWTRRESLNIISLKHYMFNAIRYKVIRYFQHESVKRKFAEHYRFFEEVYETMDNAGSDLSGILPELIESLSALPERCQVAFKLRLYENLSNGEIAERMNITKKTVEVYMFKAFDHFRSALSIQKTTI